MAKATTKTGDAGRTGMRGKGRLPKFDVLMDTLGTVDEATSALGAARACRRDTTVRDVLLHIHAIHAICMSSWPSPWLLPRIRGRWE